MWVEGFLSIPFKCISLKRDDKEKDNQRRDHKLKVVEEHRRKFGANFSAICELIYSLLFLQHKADKECWEKACGDKENIGTDIVKRIKNRHPEKGDVRPCAVGENARQIPKNKDNP